MEKTSGILIRKIRLTESSLIATWIGDESGKIKTVIRSALKTGNKFSGKVDLFYEAEVFYTRPKKGSDLCHLEDISVRHRFESARKDYTAMVMCSYFAEITDITTEFFHPLPTIYDLLRRALAHLEETPPTLRSLYFFEKEMCRHLGIHDSSTPDGKHYLLLFEYGGRRTPLRDTLLQLLVKSG